MKKLASSNQSVPSLSRLKKTTIREVYRALGYMVSSFPGVMYGPLYFHQLEREKTLALRYSKGDYDAFRVVSDKACNELMWWNTHTLKPATMSLVMVSLLLSCQLMPHPRAGAVPYMMPVQVDTGLQRRPKTT